MKSESLERRRWSWRLGKPFGIVVYVHATFWILLAWVLVSHLVSGHGLPAALAGVALMLCVFAIVVTHELSHALVARRFGIRTRDITLLPIGGVASLEHLPDNPRHELYISLAGPAVNIALAALFAAILLAIGGPLSPAELTVVGGSFLTKLLWVNVSLAVFNLLPAFPMDGGRVLRAALALRKGHVRATEIAASLGQAMALLFALLGLFFNPVLLFIAFFVWIGAQHEAAASRLKAELSRWPVRRAMVTSFESLSPTDPLSRAVELVLAGFQQDFPVLQEGRPVGVLTRTDLVRALAEHGPDSPVGEAMHPGVETVLATDALEGALGRLQREPSTPLVVVDSERVVGMLTPENIGELLMFDRALEQHQRAPT